MDTRSTVVVVGAGFAGLSAARDLHFAGVDVVVVEARDRVGGRVHSIRLSNGAVAELGAEWIMDGDGAVRGLAEDLGLELAESGVDYVMREAPGDGGASLEEQRRALEVAQLELGRLSDDEVRSGSVGAFIDGLPVSEPQRRTLRARIQGSISAELDGITLRITEAERAFHAGSGPYRRTTNGNQEIALSIARSLPDVRLEHVVDEISAGGTHVTVRGDRFELPATAAVVAVPAPVAASLRFTPGLPEEQRAALAELPMGVASKLAAAAEPPPPLRARQDVEIPYWCWAARRGGDEAAPVVAAFAGSPSAQERLRTASGDASTWMERLRSLNPDVRFTGEAVMKAWADDPFARGSYSAFDARSWDRIELLRRPAGRVAFAGEHTAGPHDYATMNGAILSGRRAAQDVLRILG
jgi:monoamine oxidase